MKSDIVLMGPKLEAVSGVATHLRQILSSSLSEKYSFLYFQVGSEGRNENLVGRVSRLVLGPVRFLYMLIVETPSLVHINSSLEPKAYWRDIVFLSISNLLRKKVIFQVHGGELPDRFLGSGKIAHAFLRSTLNLADAVVLLASIEEINYREFGITTKMAIIPNAIDTSVFHRELPKKIIPNEIKLGYIGRLADDKGVDDVISAYSLLLKHRGERYSLHIAGSGPSEGRLKALAAEMGLKDAVHFVGPVFDEDKVRFWESIDIFIFPTFHREGLPYTILESLASGTPIITTRVGGIPDVVREGKEGIFVRPRDPDSVARAVESLVADPGRFEKISAAGMQRAREYYAIERLVRQFDELYQGLL